MTEDSHGITLRAWSPADAGQVARRHGQPSHPNWVQPKTDSPGSSDEEDLGPDIKQVNAIHLYVPDHGGHGGMPSHPEGLWGGPPAEELQASEAWSALLADLSCHLHLTVNRLVIRWNKATQISMKVGRSNDYRA